MAALTQAVKQLKAEQRRLESELERVNNALQALNHIFGKRGRKRAVNGTAIASLSRRRSVGIAVR